LKPFDTNGNFKPLSEEKGKLRKLAVQGAGTSLFASGAGLAIQIISTMVLARILVPQDFGVVAMATTFSLLLANIGLNGITEAVVQRESLSHAVASNLFWINIGVGLLLTAGFAASGSLLARFYHDARVAAIAVGVSVTIVVTSLSVVHLALLKRAMRFPSVSVNDICARCISALIAIVLGFAGWGYWALVAGVVALPLSTAIGAWYLCRWVPSLPRRAEGTGEMVVFAVHTYGFFGINYCARNLDNFLIGWRFNAQALGFYKKAYDLFALSSGQISSSLTLVVLSTLSRLSRDIAQYRRYFLRALAVLAFVGMAIAADLTLVGTDLIRLLLGPGWEASGRIFTFFAPGIGLMLIYVTYGWIHLSIGRPDRRLRWGIVEFIVTAMLFLVALPWGPDGIAIAWTVSFLVLLVPAFWYAGKPIGFGVVPVLSTIWRYAAAALLAGCASSVVVRKIPFLLAMGGAKGALIRVLSVSVLFVFLYLGAVIILFSGITPLTQFAGLIRDMLPRQVRETARNGRKLRSCEFEYRRPTSDRLFYHWTRQDTLKVV